MVEKDRRPFSYTLLATIWHLNSEIHLNFFSLHITDSADEARHGFGVKMLREARHNGHNVTGTAL